MAAKTAGSWAVTEPAGIEALTTFGTTQLHKLGRRCKAVDTGSTDYGPAEFIYLEGCASIVRGDVVVYNDNYLCVRSVGGLTGACAVALGACVASNYGWFQILGRGVATSNTTIVDGTQAYICGTAGMIDDAVLAGDAIVGMIISSTTDTATCVVNMTTYPVVADMNAT
jgi:hypothetical protein